MTDDRTVSPRDGSAWGAHGDPLQYESTNTTVPDKPAPIAENPTDDVLDPYRCERERVRRAALEPYAGMPTTGDLALLLERFWAAGFFDGEGCASVSEVARPGEPSLRTADLAGPTPKHELAIKQGYGEMGHENLKRFQAAVGGVGRISEPQPGGGNSADYRVWRVTDEKDVAIVFRAIAPFVGPQKYADLVTALNVSALRDMRSVMLGTRRKGASPGSIASFPPE